MKTVSVWMITYNHEKYIREALEGVLMQQVDFEWEVVISDDASTDDTPKILREYQRKYPKLIRLFLHKKNMGMTQNMRFTLEKCNSKYVAMCEGDDYWTYPRKLQKQVDYLEANPECSITAHNVEVISSNGKSLWWNKPVKSDINIEHLLKYGSGGPTCSLVFRNHIFTYPKWFKGHLAGDWLTQILCAQHGYVYRFYESMGVYRKHSGGSVHATAQIELKHQTKDLIGLPQKYTLRFIDLLDNHFIYKFRKQLNYHRAINFFELAKAYFFNEDYQRAKLNFNKSIELGFVELSSLKFGDFPLIALMLTPYQMIPRIIKVKRQIFNTL